MDGRHRHRKVPVQNPAYRPAHHHAPTSTLTQVEQGYTRQEQRGFRWVVAVIVATVAVITLAVVLVVTQPTSSTHGNKGNPIIAPPAGNGAP
jgi:hypothetical protein